MVQVKEERVVEDEKRGAMDVANGTGEDEQVRQVKWRWEDGSHCGRCRGETSTDTSWRRHEFGIDK